MLITAHTIKRTLDAFLALEVTSVLWQANWTGSYSKLKILSNVMPDHQNIMQLFKKETTRIQKYKLNSISVRKVSDQKTGDTSRCKMWQNREVWHNKRTWSRPKANFPTGTWLSERARNTCVFPPVCTATKLRLPIKVNVPFNKLETIIEISRIEENTIR